MGILPVLMRFIHILSAITLVGGVFAWRFGAIPAGAALAPDTRAKVENAFAAAWRPAVLAAILGLLASGSYNFMAKMGSGHLSPAYHAVFGVKFLLALHVFAITLIATKPDNAKRARQLVGVAASGLVIVILSAVLRTVLGPQ